MLFIWMNYVTPWHVWRHTWRQRNDMSSTSQCRHEEDMCANKNPKNDGCIFNGSRDIEQALTLGLTDPARVPVLQTEREFCRVKYEWIQVWAVSDKLNVCSSLWRRVMWSRVSKAANISRAARIVTFPESMVSMIWLVSLSKAVSVEQNFRYADWRGEKLGEIERWGKRRAKAKHSNILPIVF